MSRGNVRSLLLELLLLLALATGAWTEELCLSDGINRFPDEKASPCTAQNDAEKSLLRLSRAAPLAEPVSQTQIALICVWLGDLPAYLPYFLRSLQHAQRHSNVQVLIFCTSLNSVQLIKEEYDLPNNTQLHFIDRNELASRVQMALGGTDTVDPNIFLLGAKGNDLKPLYGSLFERELAQFSHWGWIDIDMVLGDLGFLMQDVEEGYDVVTYPDGALNAIYLSGQLTVFTNSPYFRNCFTQAYSWTDGSLVANLRHAYMIAEEGHRVWDERYAIWYALRSRRIKMKCDFSRQVVAALDWVGNAYHHIDGRLYHEHNAAVRSSEIDHNCLDMSINRIQSEMDSLSTERSCVPWFNEGWTWRCLPCTRFGQFIWNGTDLIASAVRRSAAIAHVMSTTEQQSYTFPNNVFEYGFLHLHQWKSTAQHKYMKPTGTVFSVSRVRESPSKGSSHVVMWGSFNQGALLLASDLEGTSSVQGSPSGQKPSSRADMAVPTRHPPQPDSTASSGSEHIPNVVHLISTDEGTRYFDWTRFVCIMSIHHHLKPKAIKFHVLNGILPYGDWWEASKHLLSVHPFRRDELPRQLNGVDIANAAHLSDLKRMRLLLEEGGVYLDLDNFVLQSFDPLLQSGAGLVLGRQHTDTIGIGVIIASPQNQHLRRLEALMLQNYDGLWVTHSVDTFTRYFEMGEGKDAADVNILPQSAFYSFSWLRPDLMRLASESGYDWSRSYSQDLCHSQSEGIVRYFSSGDLNKNTNLAAAVKLAVGADFLPSLAEYLSEFKYYSPSVQQEMQLDREEQLRGRQSSNT